MPGRKGGVAVSFTMFDKFGDALEMLDAESRGRMFIAICEYGCYGEEPVFDNPALAAIFTLLRDDIDNSMEMRGRASKGGRPRKQQVAEVSENQKPEVSENGKPNPIQSKPIQANPTHPKGGGGGQGKAFKPPTAEEVRAYAEEKRLDIDPEHFIDHYAANGWKVGKAAMKDWKAAARNWVRSPYRKAEAKEADYGADAAYLNAW